MENQPNQIAGVMIIMVVLQCGVSYRQACPRSLSFVSHFWNVSSGCDSSDRSIIDEEGVEGRV